MKRTWFKAKDYGWGWYPVTWQGWLIVVLWLASTVSLFRGIDSVSHSASDTLIRFSAPGVILTFLLLLICWKTGERPEWRWAGRRASWASVLARAAGIVAIAFVVAAVVARLLADRL